MDEALVPLVEAAVEGSKKALAVLVDALCADGGVAVSVLAELADRPEKALRLAAARAVIGRPGAAAARLAESLAEDGQRSVRRAIARGLARNEAWVPGRCVETLLADADAELRELAVKAAVARHVAADALIGVLERDDKWELREKAAKAFVDWYAPGSFGALVRALGRDEDADVARACARGLDNRLGAGRAEPAAEDVPGHRFLFDARNALHHLGAHRMPHLAKWLDAQLAGAIDRGELRRLGTDLTARAEQDELPRGHDVDSLVAAVLDSLFGPPPHAAVLLGPAGSGKTAIVHEVVHALRAADGGPWRVLRMTPPDFLRGTKWLGEWQTRVGTVVDAIRKPRRVLLYVPNLEELAMVGRSSSGQDNVATMLAPHIEEGAITILGESTHEGFQRGLGQEPSLQRLFTPIEVTERDEAATQRILCDVALESGIDLDDAVRDRLVDLADLYLAGVAQPGRAVSLLRLIAEGARDEERPVTVRDVLDTLSATSGIPADFLDDTIALDVEALRGFFESRVMGQPTAVEAICDLVTLVKAGLADPEKPLGVLCFVGPTGVGKTALARALAAYLFGSEERLVRFDMSEFATYDAYQRLIGTGGADGLLTAAVRRQPFSVLLLDEIEKAHLNVFDLCLQIFDAGRLRDHRGRLANFRQSIVILTSNVGAGEGLKPAVGFGHESAPAADRENLMKALQQVFRPEFLNRLDRVVHFLPLGTATARKIAERELSQVVQRAGIRRRALVVDTDPAVLSLLVRQGYSAAFGARPLKRTVERVVLAPLARAIAAGKTPAGSVVRLSVRGDGVRVEVLPPESDDGAEAATPGSRAAVQAVAKRAAVLAAGVEQLAESAAAPAARKAALLARTSEPGFWEDRAAATTALDEIHRLDHLLSALDLLGKRSRDTEVQSRQLSKNRPAPDWITRRLDELDREAALLAFLLACRDSADMGDAIVEVRLVNSTAGDLDGVRRIAGMYRGLAARRGLDCEVLDDRCGGEPHEDAVTLSIAGAGAFALLRGEAGLHQLSRTWVPPGPGQRKREDRDVVRVDVFSALAPRIDRTTVEVETFPLTDVPGRLLPSPDLEVRLTHTPSLTSVHAWTRGPREDAVERLLPLLAARAETPAASPAGGDALLRRYILGPSPLVRDRRTGHTTGHLDRVLEGALDPFLAWPEA